MKRYHLQKCNRVLLLFRKLPQWNIHVNCHVNVTTFQSGLRFQTGLSSFRVSCKGALILPLLPQAIFCGEKIILFALMQKNELSGITFPRRCYISQKRTIVKWWIKDLMINGKIRTYFSLHLQGLRKKAVSNFRSICYSLPSVTLRCLGILFMKTEKLLKLIFHFAPSFSI